MAKVGDSSALPLQPVSDVTESNYRRPKVKRSCTDVACLIVFGGFLTGWAFIAHYAFSQGVIDRITHPVDSRGRICGLDNAKNKPFLFYFDLSKCASPSVLVAGCLTKTICVEHCPNTTFTYLQLITAGSSRPDTKDLICDEDFDKSKLTKFEHVAEAVTLGQCAPYYLPSGPVAGRCFPGFKEGLNGKTALLTEDIDLQRTKPLNNNITFDDVLNGTIFLSTIVQTQQIITNVGKDLTKSWQHILVFFALAALAALIWIVLIRWIAGIMIGVSVVAMLAGLAYGIYFGYKRYADLTGISTANMSATEQLEAAKKQMNNYTVDLQRVKQIHDGAEDPANWLALCICCCILVVLLILIVIFLRKRVRTALAIIRMSSRAVGNMVSTLFFPILPFVMQLIALGICGACAIFLSATGNPEGVVWNSTDTIQGWRTNDTCNPNTFEKDHPNATGTCHFTSFVQHRLLVLFHFVNLFGFFWGFEFAEALGQTVLAGAFASYYWAFKKPAHVPAFPLFNSFYIAIRYHLGSIAFGSLLVASVKIIQAILKYLQKKLKFGNNCWSRFVIKVCSFCFFCLEKFIKFINRYAFIRMSMFGKNFCRSAKDAFFLLARNALRTIVIDGVVGFFLFFGKLVIMGVIGYAAYSFFDGHIPYGGQYVPRLNYFYVPVIVIVIGSYYVASVFFSVYEMAIDTIFLCFLEDLETNDGSSEKPYFMSKSLMELYGKKNTFEKPIAPVQTVVA